MGGQIVRNEEAQQDVKNGGRISLRTAQKLTDQETSLNGARELLERRDALLRELESTPEEPVAGFSHERFAKLFEAQRLNELAREKLFPSDPPNHFCSHAIVGGILFYNTAGLKRGDYKNCLSSAGRPRTSGRIRATGTPRLS